MKYSGLLDDYDGIAISSYAEKLVCSECGIEYCSRGKKDPGYCRTCERRNHTKLVGGPFDGKTINDIGGQG